MSRAPMRKVPRSTPGPASQSTCAAHFLNVCHSSENADSNTSAGEEHREHGVRTDGDPYVQRVGEHPEVGVGVEETYRETHEEQRDGVGQPAVAHRTARRSADGQR